MWSVEELTARLSQSGGNVRIIDSIVVELLTVLRRVGLSWKFVSGSGRATNWNRIGSRFLVSLTHERVDY